LISANRFAASIILKLTYGKNTATHASDPDVMQVRESLQRFVMSMRPGAYLVDSLPWLKYLPWYGRELRQGFIEDRALFHRQLDAVKRQMNDTDSSPSFVKFLLSRETDFGLDETEMAFLAGALFSAGVDTTALTFCIIMMAAACHPDAQAAVHAELDAVVGKDQLPTFDDEESLPVLRAFILESMRWRPLVTPGFAHRATEDIIWVRVVFLRSIITTILNCSQGDYHIPAGTTVFGNHW
jgi:cytochrome P450